MSTYMKSMVDDMLSEDGNQFIIENADRQGWFLFDVEIKPNQTDIVWSKNKRVCLGWLTYDDAHCFLLDVHIHTDRVNIVDNSEDVHEDVV